MRALRYSLVLITTALFLNIASAAQGQIQAEGYVELDGPRAGLTLITGKTAGYLKREYNVFPLVTQVGWQFEKRFTNAEGRFTGVTEFIILVGGFEQSLILPSLSWLFGIRSVEGEELGVGINLSLAGPAFVIATGVTKQSGNLNLPINLGIAFSKAGARISVLFGFNMRK